MRVFVVGLAVCLLSTSARADEEIAVRAAAAAGGGARGSAVYGGVDLRLDLAWRSARLGLGGRLVWLDASLRDDWGTPADALHLVRDLQLATRIGTTRLALAGGMLAPPAIAHVADGYRARLDDRPVTGLRVGLGTHATELRAELDDVVRPHFLAGVLDWQLAAPWGVIAAAAADPTTGDASLEMAVQRRYEREGVRTDLGTGMVVEPGFGLGAIAYVATALDHAGARWTTSTELRAGTGTVGGAFGPLHRLERSELYAHAHDGVGAAFTAGVVGGPGWASAGVRYRPDLGLLATATVGAPMGTRWQAAAWFAASKLGTAGAAEVRVTWPHRLASTLELGRLYDVDAMGMDASPMAPTSPMATRPAAQLSAIVWLSLTN